MSMTQRHRILVVESDDDTREVIAVILRDEGYDVCEASNGTEAIEHVMGRSKPSLLLVDWWLPRRDDADLLQELLRNEWTTPIPLLLMTCEHVPGMVQEGNNGRLHLLKKPFGLPQLLAAVRESLLAIQILRPDLKHPSTPIASCRGGVEAVTSRASA